MRDRAGRIRGSRASRAEEGLYVSRWAASRSGTAHRLWSETPRRASRYLAEMVRAQARSVRSGDPQPREVEPADHHFTMGGRLIK